MVGKIVMLSGAGQETSVSEKTLALPDLLSTKKPSPGAPAIILDPLLLIATDVPVYAL